MTDTVDAEVRTDADTDLDVEQWLEESWDPALTVGEWWARMAAAGLSHPMLPAPWGRGWSAAQVSRLVAAMVERRVLGPPLGMGLVLAAPTLLAHASDALKARYVPRILDGQEAWCQLFSEPGAGSDLAGLQTRAVRDGDEWVVTGQKVWTTLGQFADYAILLARTDPDAPKHRGISYFVLPMHQDGIEVRPLREMTGRAAFNEVFIDEARLPADHVVGELGDGWRVANTTLMVERSGIGGENIAAPSAATPGTLAGHLDRPAGDFAGRPVEIGELRVNAERLRSLVALARANGRVDDPFVRQDLARLHTMLRINDWHMARWKAGAAATGGEGNMAKLRNSDLTRLAREVGCRILGVDATVGGPASASGGEVQEFAVFSPAPSIYGGTDQVQRNVIGERVLGLPRDPGPSKDTPFRELPQNAVPRR